MKKKNNIMMYLLTFIILIVIVTIFLNMTCNKEEDSDKELDKYIKRKLY